MRFKVLVSAPYFQPIVDRYRDVFAKHGIEIIVPTVHERLSEEELLALPGLEEIDGIIAGDDRVTAQVFEKAKKLKVISKWGTGIDSFDQLEAKARGIRICNTLDAFTVPVAETVLGYMLNFVRRHQEMDRAMKNGVWDKIPGKTLAESTVGVIGVGNCGRAVLRRAAAFGARLVGNDIRHPGLNFVAETRVEMMTLDALLACADFVSLNCDLTPESRHIVNERTLSLMKPTAVLINAARGPLVDETALIHALEQRIIAGAALDVFESEPLPCSSPLLRMGNVMVAPHNANSSPAAWERVHENTLKQLLAVLCPV